MFVEPKPTERPLRMMVFGREKSGKSHLVHTATEVGPLFWQDSEGGADLYPADYGHGFRVMRSKDPWKTIQAIEQANNMVRDGEPRPIVAIDSMSSVWFQQKVVAEQVGGKKTRTPFWAWATAKKPLQELYEMLHTTRCHVIITARAKTEYEVSDSGEPTAKGLIPDVERNLPYAVDLIVMTHVREVDGEELKPGDFMATVTGTRSASVDGKPPAIPIGRTFYDPKFSDFLGAMVEGVAPISIEDTTEQQVHAERNRPQNQADLVVWIENSPWTKDEAMDALKEKFGKVVSSRIEEYYDFLRTRKPPEGDVDEHEGEAE